MQSYLFSPDLSMKISNFSKTVDAIFFGISHSHSTPKGAHACAMVSKSHDWDLRNIHYGIKKLRTPTFFFKKKLRTEFLKQLLKQIINQNPVKLPWFLITFTRRFPYDKYKLRTTSGFMLFHGSITFSSKFSQLTI